MYDLRIVAEVKSNGKWISNPTPIFSHIAFSFVANQKALEIAFTGYKWYRALFNHPDATQNYPWHIVLGCPIEDMDREDFQVIKQRGEPKNASNKWKRISSFYGKSMSITNHLYPQDFDDLDWEFRIEDWDEHFLFLHQQPYSVWFEDQIHNVVEPLKKLQAKYGTARLVYGFVQIEGDYVGGNAVQHPTENFDDHGLYS